METFKIYTLGCKVNRYDSLSLKKKLEERGLESVREGADLAIVNTCAVTRKAIRKDQEILKLAKRENPKAKIVLMGCFVKTYKERAESLGADLVWGVGELEKLLEEMKLEDAPACEMKADSAERARYTIKVQDGCEQFCTYCIIPYARGPLKSRPEKEALEEIEAAAQNGFREVVLTGIHLGLYGKDKGRPDLVGLLKKIIKIKDLKRIRLSSIEVTEVNDKLINLMAREKKMCEHLHIPLQAGSDKILKRMNRPYDKKYFLERIKELREKMPKIAITTDVIVGFPGETKKDFKETYDFIKEVNFSKLHVFPFSAHERTAAAKMDGQVGSGEIKARALTLRKLGARLEGEYAQQFRGQEVEVIIEHSRERGQAQGKTEHYLEVKFKKLPGMKAGNLVKIKEWKIIP